LYAYSGEERGIITYRCACLNKLKTWSPLLIKHLQWMRSRKTAGDTIQRITIQGLWLAELGIRFEIEKEKLNVSDNDDYKKAFTLILEDANEILQSGWLINGLKGFSKVELATVHRQLHNRSSCP
jgi:hypothetical protein